MADESNDCLECRLTSGGGLIAAGAYVIYHGKKVKTFSRHIITAIGCGFGTLGFLRIFALPPFRKHSSINEDSPKSNESEYIIGEVPSRLQ